MARLAILGCLAVVALAVQAQTSQSVLEGRDQWATINEDVAFGMLPSTESAQELQQASSSLPAQALATLQSLMPEPFEFTAGVFDDMDDSDADDLYADDFFASNVDINIPEDVLAESLAFQQAQQMQNEALLQQQEQQQEDQTADASIRLPFRLPEDVTLFGAVQFNNLPTDSSSTTVAEHSTSSYAATASPAACSDSSSDLILISRLPVGLPLQLGVLQPLSSFAGDLFNSVWQTVQQTGLLGGPVLQQTAEQQDSAVAVDDSSQDSSTPAPQQLVQQQQDDLQDQELPMDMEINVTVTSIRPQCFWSRLFNRLMGRGEAALAAMDEMEAAALAGAVVEALGRKSGPGSLQAQQQLQEMVIEMDSTGSYSSTISTGDDDDLSATAAAAIAAAAAQVMQNDPDWDGMQMDVQITHTTQRLTATWGHAILLGIAIFMIHLGLSMLLAPLYVRWFGASDDEDGAQSSQKQQKLTQQSKQSKHSQFIVSSGLKEAGVYKALLAEQEEV